MTELRTLKDLRLHKIDLFNEQIEYPTGRTKERKFVDEKELKAEAIKWVRLMPDEDFQPLQLYNKMQRKAIKDFIRMFFNLTEEDLEEKRRNERRNYIHKK